MKNSGQMTQSKDSADYYLLIISPDSDSNKLFKVEEYYTDRKPKLIGYATNSVYYNLSFSGRVISFYPNGHKQRYTNYNSGRLSGEEITYYPNGKLHYTVNHIPVVSPTQYIDEKYVECRDSTGKVLTTNGNGTWVEIDDNHIVTGQGNIVDSLQDGEWHGNIGDTGNIP